VNLDVGLWYLLGTIEASMSGYHQYILQAVEEGRFFHAYLLVHEQDSVVQEETFFLAKELREKYGVFDQYFLEPEKGSIDIEATREFRQRFIFQTVGRVKVGYIAHIEKMTLPAQQMLLKLLEEAPKNTLFVLTTTRAKLLSAPILSRVRMVRLQGKGTIQIKLEYENWFTKLFSEEALLFEKQKVIEEIEKTLISICLAIYGSEKMTKPLYRNGSIHYHSCTKTQRFVLFLSIFSLPNL